MAYEIIDEAARKAKRAAYIKAWRLANPEKAKAASDRWIAKNISYVRERRKAYAEKWRAQNGEWLRSYAPTKSAKAKERRGRDPVGAKLSNHPNYEKYKATQRAKYAADKERRRETVYQWRKNNPQAAKQINARYQKKNRIQVRKAQQAARARRAKAEGHFTKYDISEILAKQKKRCAYCRTAISRGFHIDHIQPLALGGTNYRSNIQLLCRTCNCRKGAQDPILFAQKLGLLL